MAATAPYCATYDVAALVTNLAPSGDFSEITAPTSSAINRLISQYSAWVDSRFAARGYVLPWEVVSGETWPEYQSTLLRLIVAIGVAGAISGPVLKPAPAQGRTQGKADNVYTEEYHAFLREIDINGLGFRANYRIGTPAEEFVNSPSGPLTDHLLGLLDPTRWQTVGEYTDMIQGVRQDYGISRGSIPWDHLETRRRALIGT
jgi:hypothetical protein